MVVPGSAAVSSRRRHRSSPRSQVLDSSKAAWCSQAGSESSGAKRHALRAGSAKTFWAISCAAPCSSTLRKAVPKTRARGRRTTSERAGFARAREALKQFKILTPLVHL